MCALSVFPCSQTSKSMRLNIVRDLVKQLTGQRKLPNKSRHLDELTHEPAIWSWNTGQWLSYLTAVNWPYCECPILKSYIKDVDLPRYAWDTPPFLFIVSPTPPVQSVDAYVRSVNHVTTKRKEVDHIPWVWGSVPRALRARGSSAKNRRWVPLFSSFLYTFTANSSTLHETSLEARNKANVKRLNSQAKQKKILALSSRNKYNPLHVNQIQKTYDARWSAFYDFPGY